MAMTLADIRSKYPQYKDVPDQTLADKLYDKYYAHADRREFDARIGLNPYDNALEVAGKAAVGAPAQIMQGVSGVGEMLAEGEAGNQNAVYDKLGPKFKLADLPRGGVDTGNYARWATSKLRAEGVAAPTPADIEAFSQRPNIRESYAEYLRNLGPNSPEMTGDPNAPQYLGTSPTRVAKAELKGKLERQQYDKFIPKLDAAPGSAGELIGNVVGSIAQMAPGYAASIALRNPAPAVALAQVLTTGQSYAQARDAGVEPGRAAEYALQSGFAEAVGEALPLSIILKEGGGKLLPKLFKAGTSEALQEGVTQFIQSMLESGTINPDMTWEDVKKQVGTAMATGAVAGGVLTGAVAAVDALGRKKPTAEDVSAEVLKPAEAVIADEPIENQVALPAPDTLLALPSPEMFAPPPINRRQPQLPADGVDNVDTLTNGPIGVQYGRNGQLHMDGVLHSDGRITSAGAEKDEAEYLARVALQRSRQTETKELLQTARETISPLGTFSVAEVGGPAAQRVNQRRIQLGRPLDAPITIEELASAKVPQAQIDAVIAARRPATSTDPLTALDITRAAEAKNIVGNDGNFAELAYRTTGTRDPMRMTQTQLRAFKAVLDTLPAHDKLVTVPIADQPAYTEDQYGKALDAVRNAGRYTPKAIKDATGLKNSKDVVALRDAMVRRGQLVQRSPNDFRLYDVLGEERQTTPDDVPNGAFKDYVVRRIPVSKVRVRQNGKAVGVFGSASEARSKVSAIRASEKDARSEVAIEPAEETAWGVLENRYDEQGNLLGQVIVDSSRDEAAMRRAADQMSRPDTGPQYTQTTVEAPPKVDSEPVRRAPAPEAVAGRTDEILKRLNKLAAERKLPLLGVRVKLGRSLATPDGRPIEGMYLNRLIRLSMANITSDMTDDQIVDRLAQVMDHELIHALREAGVLGPETDGWKTIMRYARRAKRPGASETYFEWARRNYAGERGYENPDTIEEEAIAEAFRHWAANKRNVPGKPGTVFSQLVEWFKRLFRSVPDDLFEAIETGRMVEDALRPPGAEAPRAKATRAMQSAQQDIAAAQAAGDENAVRTYSRAFLRARAQAREDRYGRSGPKTVLGTTPSKAFETAPIMERSAVAEIADRFRQQNGVSRGRLMTYLPEDVGYLARVADAQQRAAHDPTNNAVAKAYRALIDETRAMWNALGPLDVTAWTENGAPYASPADMLNDVLAGQLKLRLSADMFGPGADNPGHPLNNVSGVKTVDGLDLTHNDLLRVVHDIYGHGQSGFRDNPQGQYNAYHEHARLLSPEAARALATETLAQGSWANYGPHLRRKDGTVPRVSDVDYLPQSQKEFAEQKAFLLSPDLIAADPGWALAEKAEAAEPLNEDAARFSKFDENLPGGRLYGNPNRSPGGALSKPGTPSPTLTNPRPGNQYFGGELAEHQLQMARTGDRGAALVYLSPDDFLALTDGATNPEQEVYDAAIDAGYKFAGYPSLVLDGYAGNVRAVQSDAAFSARALAGRSGPIPVVLYPKRAEGLGLITALEGPDGTRVAFPHEGFQEFDPDAREDGGPKYSLNAPMGERVPSDPPNGVFNILQQRTDGAVGRFINSLGRSKRSVLGLPSIFDARVKLQDKMLSIKEMIEDIKANGGSITDLNDTYMLEQLYHGKVFEQIREREETLQLPLLEALKAAHDGPSKITPKEFEDYLYARHAPERNAYLRTRGAVAENPSGMSDAEAGAILDRFALDGKMPEMMALEALARRITANTTATRIEGGLISPDTESPYQHYVPLRGFAEEDLDPDQPTENQTRARSGKGFSVGGREDRSVTGRTRKAGDLLGHLFLQNTEAVIRAEKNQVAMSFLRLLQENPQAGYGQILRTAPTRLVAGANGMIHAAGDPSYRQAPDIVTAKFKGQEIIARVVDPRLARAIKSDYVTTSNDLVNFITRWAGMLNRYLATINTAWNPEFLISNLARDAQTAGILSQQYDIPQLGRKILGNAPKAMAGIREVLRDGTAESDWARTFLEMQKAGGTTEFLGIHDLETQVRGIRRSVTQTGLNVTARKAFEYIGKVGKFVGDYNKVAENAFRLSAYHAARESGATIPQAAYLAKNLTVNFNKGGELKGFMNAMYLFYNASTQGTAVLLNGLKSKRVQKIVAGVVVMGVMQDLINRAISGDEDDNGVKDYDDIPDYILETNFVLMDPMGLLKSVGIDKGYIAIPMPYGFNAFYNLGRNMSAGFSGSPVRNPASSAVDSAMTFVSAFNPIGGVQSVWNFIAPTIADPAVDLITNKDFAGNDIVPERPSFGLPVPNSQKYWSNTGAIPKDTAALLNSTTGGNEVRPGAVDISPEQLQYAFDYAFGSMGKFALRIGKLATETGPQALQGDFADIEIGDIPFARRVVGSIGSRGATERYYQVAQEVKYAAAEMKLAEEDGNIAMARQTIANHPVEVRLIDAFDDAEKSLQDLRKQLRDLRENENIPAPRKREIEKRIKDAQDRLMAQMTKLYFTQKGAAANRP